MFLMIIYHIYTLYVDVGKYFIDVICLLIEAPWIGLLIFFYTKRKTFTSSVEKKMEVLVKKADENRIHYGLRPRYVQRSNSDYVYNDYTTNYDSDSHSVNNDD
ncbi:hypothetical protein WA158_007485 [Blastocystis sp. Blastoise]